MKSRSGRTFAGLNFPGRPYFHPILVATSIEPAIKCVRSAPSVEACAQRSASVPVPVTFTYPLIWTQAGALEEVGMVAKLVAVAAEVTAACEKLDVLNPATP